MYCVEVNENMDTDNVSVNGKSQEGGFIEVSNSAKCDPCMRHCNAQFGGK